MFTRFIIDSVKNDFLNQYELFMNYEDRDIDYPGNSVSRSKIVTLKVLSKIIADDILNF